MASNVNKNIIRDINNASNQLRRYNFEYNTSELDDDFKTLLKTQDKIVRTIGLLNQFIQDLNKISEVNKYITIDKQVINSVESLRNIIKEYAYRYQQNTDGKIVNILSGYSS